ncbi:MAG: DUF3577 domain-containing protein [Aquabacterium sp.]
MSKQPRQPQVSQQSEVTYFDFLSTGVGYLNRIRDVNPREGGPAYVACSINILVGPSSNVTYRYLDCRVVGKQALEAVDIIYNAMQSDQDKVIVTFRVGDIRPDSYTINKRDRNGNEQPEIRHGLKGRLLQITSAKINGVAIDLPQIEHDDAPASDVQDDAQPSQSQRNEQRADYDDSYDEEQATGTHGRRQNQRAAAPVRQQQRRYSR